MDEKSGSNIVDVGVDLSEFYMSVEWDILEVPAVRWVNPISCLPSLYRQKKREVKYTISGRLIE